MLLNCHTYYSLRYGVLSLKDLFKEIKANGYHSFALTDINNTSACLDFIRLAPENGIRPIVGIDFRTGAQQDFIGIARNNEGFKELNQHLTQRINNAPHLFRSPQEFLHSYVIYPFIPGQEKSLKDHEYIGIKPSQLNKFRFSSWNKQQHKLVILHPVTFKNQLGFNIHRLLRAIDNNTLLSKLSKSEQATPDEILIPKHELYELFKDFPQLIRNTENLLNDCAIHFEYGTNKNKRSFTASEYEDFDLLRQEAEKGLTYRYSNPSQKVIDRMNMELGVIQQMNFASYFLINWDMVNYAQHKNYYYVGRGSGANSLVAYLLRITDVDPIELDLYFERFINPSRKNPPDFDIDFSWTDRDDVTKYLFDKYSWQHTALVGTYITFKPKAISRELGKVFGLPAHEIDKLQQIRNPAYADDLGKLVLKYSNLFQLKEFPSHLSVHSSGILISEEPIQTYSATFIPPKGFPTTQFSMIEAEDVGLYKFDILSQRGLGKIKDSLTLIKENRNIDIDIHDIKKFKEDPAIKNNLKQGKAIGCFYVESPAMRMLLTKLKTDSYTGLVAASSIIRPGVAKSGMMREYILRFRDKNRRKQAQQKLPKLYNLLADTYGVMVYQEDVLRVAHYFAGLTLEEADILRRGMSWKFRERVDFWVVKDKFFSNCRERGYDTKVTEQIWNQIESFANYAFAKGHSASYAVESYQALYLKAYFPLEYLVATVNHGGGFYRIQTYLHEARMLGATIEAPCINTSNVGTSINGDTIWLGFHLIKDLERSTIEKILNERIQNGLFLDLPDILNRISISLEQLQLLIRIGALRFINKQQKALLWDVHLALGNKGKSKPTAELFRPIAKQYKLPQLHESFLEKALDQMELLGFPLCSPFLLIDNPPVIPTRATDLKNKIGQTIEIIAYLVHVKKAPTSNGKLMLFGVFLDLDGHWVDTVHFPPVAKQFPFKGMGSYHIHGTVIEEFGFISIEASKIEKLPMMVDD